MSKRLLLVLPLALALAACGSSGGGDTPATPAGTAAASQSAPMMGASTSTTPTAAPLAAATSTAPASARSSAGAATTPAASDTTAAGAAASTGLSAEAKAARAKAAHNFVDNGKWVEGENYFLIEPQQPKVTNTPKIEVVEVFSYGCPACNAAHQMVDKMAAALPSYATMAYLPAGFRPDENWVVYQRAYYAAKALGIADQSHDAMFDATWKTGETATYNLATGRPKPRSEWPDIQDIAKFYSQYGVSPEQFVAVANSFAVNTKVKRADELVQDYGVRATPTIVVDGRYRFDFRSAGGTYTDGIELAKYLVAKEAKRLEANAAAGE